LHQAGLGGITTGMSLIPNESPPAVRTGKRLNGQSWIITAFRRLATTNATDIRVEELARDLGVTKGSFYWHFRNRQHLLERVLEHWTERATIRITQWSKSESATGVERLARLLALPANVPPDKHGADIELAVRSWARHDKTAAEFVAKVDRMRFEYFVELIRELGFTGQEARQRAAIAQAFMLGDAFLKSDLTQIERTANARACAQVIASPSLGQGSRT
jgi:AcrR family transcriptional regulator